MEKLFELKEMFHYILWHHLLSQKILFMSWWRNSIKEVGKWLGLIGKALWLVKSQGSMSSNFTTNHRAFHFSLKKTISKCLKNECIQQTVLDYFWLAVLLYWAQVREKMHQYIYCMHYVTFFIIIQIATYVLYLGKLFLEFVI